MSVPYERIVEEDLNLGYGSVTVTMPGGGTATGNKVGLHTILNQRVFNVRDFGAVGDGVNDDTAALSALVAVVTALTTGGAILVPAGTYRLSDDVTIPADVSVLALEGARLSVDSGKTLTLNGLFRAGLTQVFAGSGSVVFGVGSVQGIHPEWFGAVGDRTTDDTVAVQKTVTTCLAGTWPHPFLAAKMYRLTASVNIDRPIYDPYPTEGSLDHGEFRFIATGPAAGFYTSTAITLFSTTYDHSTQAQSEYFSFEGIQFEASLASLSAYVIDGSFIRVRFDASKFVRIKACYAPAPCVVFSIAFDKCFAWGWEGIFCNIAGTTFDISFEGNKFEAGGTGIQTSLAQGCRFLNNLFEDCTGPFLVVKGCRGLLVVGNYFEGIATSTGSYYIDLVSTGGLPVAGAFIAGNMFYMTADQIADASFYAVNCGGGSGLHLAGNYSNGKLEKLTAETGVVHEFHETGNVAESKASTSPVYGDELRLTANIGGAYNFTVYNLLTVVVTKAFGDDLFDAAALTDSAVVWQQPANSVLVGARIITDETFVAAGLTSLVIDVGDADTDGLINCASNFAATVPTNVESTRGALWNGGAVGTEYYTAVAKDWTASALAVGANLSTLSAGSVTFYFTYRPL